MMENRKYWSGDYYPLTPWTMAPDRWLAWQMHRPDLDEGIVLAFRHQDCPYSALEVNLNGLKPEETYVVRFIDEDHHAVTKKMSGKELTSLELHIPKRHESLLIRHAPRRKS